VKYCADLKNGLFYSHQCYFKVPIENRLFFYPKDVLTALQKKFKPSPDCDGWLHKVWTEYQAPPRLLSLVATSGCFSP